VLPLNSYAVRRHWHHHRLRLLVGREEDNAVNSWTAADFEQLCWHDNPIHGLAIREGEHGSGELELDIDYILEWLCDKTTGHCDFRIAPATLTFHEVTDLVLSLDYLAMTASLCPPSIGEIQRAAYVYPNGYRASEWTIEINWPAGSIRFKGEGFTQVLRANPIVVDRQVLTQTERRSA